MTSLSKIASAFDLAAQTYDTEASLQKRVAQILAKELLGLNYTPCSILEIGCGTGFLTKLLKEAFPNTDYYATDIAPSMIAVCREKLKDYKNVHFHIMDGEKLDFNQRQEWIVSSLAVQWFEDFQTSLKQMWQASNVLAFTTLVKGSLQEWKEICDEANVKNRVIEFISKEELIILCEDLNPSQFIFKVNSEVQQFENALQFLRNLKKIGAYRPHECYRPINLNKVLKQVKTNFSVTYQVAYCILCR